MKKVTMQAIADSLGISKMSVSKCFQGSDDISSELKNKVLETAAAMGYVYPKPEKKKVFVLLSERFLDPSDKFYSGMLRELNAISDTCQMNFIIQIISKLDDKACSLSADLKSADGIILLGQVSREYTACVQKIGKPTICVDFEWLGIELDRIVCNSYRSSYRMTMYLIQRGHRKIAFVGNLNSTNSIDDRYMGYRKALLQSGIPYCDDYQFDEFDENGDRISLVLPEEVPTAFVCNNDYCAFLTIKQLQSMGYRIPHDMSVVGFDNMLYAKVSNPGITSVNVPVRNIVKSAVKQLGRRISDPDRPACVINIECDLIERDSVADI